MPSDHLMSHCVFFFFFLFCSLFILLLRLPHKAYPYVRVSQWIIACEVCRLCPHTALYKPQEQGPGLLIALLYSECLEQSLTRGVCATNVHDVNDEKCHRSC